MHMLQSTTYIESTTQSYELLKVDNYLVLESGLLLSPSPYYLACLQPFIIFALKIMPYWS